MSTIEETRKLAEDAWKKFKGNGIARKKCSLCFEKWKANGRVPEEKPPFFPPDFEGPCPRCGNSFQHPSIPF